MGLGEAARDGEAEARSAALRESSAR